MSHDQLPAEIFSLAEVPKRDQPLYESDGAGAYKLSYVGRHLAAYRRQVAENPGADVPPPPKIVNFDREGWSRLLAVAEPGAKKYFLRLAGAGIVKIAR
jgi:hypothetical protein